MCICIHMYAGTHVNKCAHVCRYQRSTPGVLPQELLFETRSPTGLSSSSRVGSQPAPAFLMLVLQVCTTRPGFFIWILGSNSYLQACLGSILPTELLPQPSTVSTDSILSFLFWKLLQLKELSYITLIVHPIFLLVNMPQCHRWAEYSNVWPDGKTHKFKVT